MSIDAAAESKPKWRRIGRLLAVIALLAALWSAATSDMSTWRTLGVAGVALVAVAWLLWDIRRGWRPLVTEQGGAIIAGGLLLAMFADEPWGKVLGMIALGVGLVFVWLL